MPIPQTIPEYCSDMCPYCGIHTNKYASMYNISLNFIRCPDCREILISDAIYDIHGQPQFTWRKPLEAGRSGYYQTSASGPGLFTSYTE